MNEQLIKWGAAVFISFYVINMLFRYMFRTGGHVLKEDCRNFRTRIGKESDDHRKDISALRHDITEIKEGVAFLKGRSNNG